MVIITTFEAWWILKEHLIYYLIIFLDTTRNLDLSLIHNWCIFTQLYFHSGDFYWIVSKILIKRRTEVKTSRGVEFKMPTDNCIKLSSYTWGIHSADLLDIHKETLKIGLHESVHLSFLFFFPGEESLASSGSKKCSPPFCLNWLLSPLFNHFCPEYFKNFTYFALNYDYFLAQSAENCIASESSALCLNHQNLS